jgi:hypothetical protein
VASFPPRDARTLAETPETVATVRVYAAIAPAFSEEFEGGDLPLFEAVAGSLDLIRAQVRASVAERLGPEFDVDVGLQRGSIELVAAIVLVGSVVMTYGAVRSGLDYIRNDVALALRGVLNASTRVPIEIAPYVTLGPAMSKFALSEQPNSSSGAPSMTYLIVMASLVIAGLLTTLLVVVFVKVL